MKNVLLPVMAIMLLFSCNKKETSEKENHSIDSGFNFYNTNNMNNSVWELTGCVDFEGQDFVFPDGVLIVYKGGSFINGDNLGLNNVTISAPRNVEVFDTTFNFTGSLGNQNISANWFGAKTTSTDNSKAIQNALNVASGKTVELSSGVFKIAKTLIIPNSRNLVGQGYGFGSNKRTELLYLESDKGAIDVAGNYCLLKGFILNAEDGNNAYGIKYLTTRSNLEYVTVQNFNIGIRNKFGSTTFDHFHDRVYVSHCDTGAIFQKANNIVFRSSYFVSNGDAVILDTVTQASFTDGCVLEIFGEKLKENPRSKIFRLKKSNAITVRDCYFEVTALRPVPFDSTKQQLAVLENIKGFTFEGNYINTSAHPDQIPLIEPLNENVKGVSIKNNVVNRLGNNVFLYKGEEGTSYALASISNNVISSNSNQSQSFFTPKILVNNVEDTTIEYSVQEGSFHVSEGMIQVTAKIGLKAKGQINGYLSIGNFPVSMKSKLNNEIEVLGNVIFGKSATDIANVNAKIEKNQDFVRLYKGADYTSLVTNDLKDNSYIILTINYPIDVNSFFSQN